MIKKIVGIGVALSLILSTSSGIIGRAESTTEKMIVLQIDNPKMMLDGKMVEIDPGKGTTPKIVDGRTLLPIRTIVETMGGKVDWNSAEKKTTITLKNLTLELWNDKKETKINGKSNSIDVAPRIIRDRTYLPLRFITENLGCNVNWISKTSSAVISYNPDTVGSNVITPKSNKKLTWFLVGPGQEPETDKILKKANEYLKGKLDGVTIDLKVFSYGDDYNQKVNTALATGEAFDICFTGSWAADIRANANAGYFKQLDDYLAKDDTITKIVGQDFMNGVKINGKTFAVPTNKEKVHNWGFLLKKDLVYKYKIDTTKIRKMEDLEPYFEMIKMGEVGVTPLLSVQMEAPFKLLDWDCFLDDDIPGALYSDNRDNKVINQFNAPETIAHFKKMREYNKKGYLSKDAVTMENFNDQLKTGKYFACVQSLKPGKDIEMRGSTGGIDWVQVNITKPVMSNRETMGSLLAIPTRSKNPDLAFKFITMLYTDEYLNNLFVYGIEGEHYKKNGNIVTLLGGERSGYKAGNGWRFGDQFKNYLMDNEDPKKWEKFTSFNSNGLPLNSLGFSFDKKPVSAEVAACRSVVQKYYKQFFTGCIEVDPNFAAMNDKLSAAGVDKLIAEMQKQYDFWLANYK